jgi:hypothetical protein
MTITLADTIILSGYHSPDTKLWHIKIPPSPGLLIPAAPTAISHTVYATIGSATPAQLVVFAHAALFSAVLSTLALALDKGYIMITPSLSNKISGNDQERPS